jgi:uncharacterized protein with NRDE domain
MCVLTYIPHADGRLSITHNRDEHIHRPTALAPAWRPAGTGEALYPIDPQGGGTWFALHRDWVCCLLNGGFARHTRRAEGYRMSRGQVIPQLLAHSDVAAFARTFDPVGMEPFTLVLADLAHHKLHQYTWDERIWHVHHLDAGQPAIWSSSTLYDVPVKISRQQLFRQFLQQTPTPAQIFDFHTLHVKGDVSRGLFVNINDTIKTVSIIQANGTYQSMRMRYEAFI